MRYMKYGKYIALAGLVIEVLLLLVGGDYDIGAVICVIGLIMMLINGVTKAADKTYNETIPKAIGRAKTTAKLIENTAEWDKAIDTFLNQHGGMWILRTTNGIVLETKSGECISFKVPPSLSNCYVDHEKYDEHLARKYNCSIQKHHNSQYHSGGDVYHVNYGINGNISSISSNDSVSYHYTGATLMSPAAQRVEKAKMREIYKKNY